MLEWKPGALGYVEKAGVAIGLVQHPEKGELIGTRIGTAEPSVETSLAKLRLTPGRKVAKSPISLDDLEDRQCGTERIFQAFAPNQVEIVGRRVILGIIPLR